MALLYIHIYLRMRPMPVSQRSKYEFTVDEQGHKDVHSDYAVHSLCQNKPHFINDCFTAKFIPQAKSITTYYQSILEFIHTLFYVIMRSNGYKSKC